MSDACGRDNAAVQTKPRAGMNAITDLAPTLQTGDLDLV